MNRKVDGKAFHLNRIDTSNFRYYCHWTSSIHFKNNFQNFLMLFKEFFFLSNMRFVQSIQKLSTNSF